MDKKKLIFWMMLFLILTLLLFQWKIDNLKVGFEHDCQDVYDVNGTCPCQPTKSSIPRGTFNFSNINLSKA